MLKVVITTAARLDAGSAEKLKKAIAKKHGSDVEFEFRTDPAVIGGVKAVIGSQLIDATVAGRLAQVRRQLLAQI